MSLLMNYYEVVPAKKEEIAKLKKWKKQNKRMVSTNKEEINYNEQLGKLNIQIE